ncbi:hypothetical protein [Tateyamaria pelophila]|uniref:hypothetical protein n=1 Tax=Tateyamaria pelophila TaxID=328415 RepID=UPI001CBB2B69|nr:hypothetical protein [Tateyamaria pelophila]
MRPLFLTAMLMLASPAMGGAWMREPGTGFLAFGPVYEETGRLTGSLYVEYGVRPNLTIGAKFDADMTLQQIGNSTGFVFLRRPIKMDERPFKLAYEVGIGSTFGAGNDLLLLTGLSYGRGISVGSRNGWLAIDGAVEWSAGDTSTIAKLDTTLGLTLSDKFKVMMQVFHSQTDEASATTLAPSVIWQPRPEKASYQLGIEAESGTLALKFGVWRSF